MAAKRAAQATPASSLLTNVVLLLLFALFGGAAVAVAYAYWLLPSSVLGAWPVAVLVWAPVLLMAPLVRRFFRRDHVACEPQPLTAGSWLRARVAARGPAGVSVGRQDGAGDGYYPGSRTIVLADHTASDRSMDAYAVAAHELGHAIAAVDRAWFDVVRCYARAHAWEVFAVAMAIMVGVAMTGAIAWLPVVATMVAAAFALQVVVVHEELVASRHAMRELASLDLAPAQRRAVRRHLLVAFSTYALVAVTIALPLLLWPVLTRFFGDGLLRPAPPLSAWQSQVSLAAAYAIVFGNVLSLGAWLPEPLRGLLSLPGTFAKVALVAASPLLCALLWDQPLGVLSPWAVLLAVPTAIATLGIPFAGPIAWLTSKVQGTSSAPMFTAREPSLPVIPAATLARRPSGFVSISVIRLLWLAAVPLALLRLGWI